MDAAGFRILISAVALGAHLMLMSAESIAVGEIVLARLLSLGSGILSGVEALRRGASPEGLRKQRLGHLFALYPIRVRATIC
jgi:hypothetical protein